MNAPKVTVTMAVYNAQRYLRQAIESILSQTFGDFELLIVDDGSTDDSPSIIRTYSDVRVRVLRNEANRGVAYSRKRALLNAKGDYVAVLDADDVSFPNRLETQVACLDTDPDMVAVCSDYEVIDENGKPLQFNRKALDYISVHWRLLFGNPIANSSTMFRRRMALEVGGYDETGLYGTEDFDLWSRLAKRGGIARLDIPIIQYRQHPDSLLHKESSVFRLQLALEIVRNNIKSLTGQEVPLDVVRYLSEYAVADPFDPATIECAYSTISLCASTIILKKAKTRADRLSIMSQLFNDLVRIFRRSPNVRRRSLAIALRASMIHSPDVIFTRKFLRFLWRMTAPEGVRKYLHSYCPAWAQMG